MEHFTITKYIKCKIFMYIKYAYIEKYYNASNACFIELNFT